MYGESHQIIFRMSLFHKDGELSQTGISISQLREIYFTRFVHNKKQKVVLQNAMRPDFIKTRNHENESITFNEAFMPPCLLFHVILEILGLISIYHNVLSENKHFAIRMWQKI